MLKTVDNASRPVWRCVECGVIVVVAAVMRCLFVGKADIGNDECFSLYYACRSLSDIAVGLSTYDNPPLWELILHFWVMLFGVSVVSLRMLSLIFSVMTVVPIWLIGERYVGRHVGLLASAMYAFSTLSIFLSHDGRVYSLLAMLSAWSLYLFLTVFDKNYRGRAAWVWLAVVNVLIMYSHYMAFWVIVVEAMVLLFVPGAIRRLWKHGLIHAAVLIVCYIPMWPVLYERFMDSGVHGTWIAKTEGFDALYFMFCHLTNSPVPTILYLVLALGNLVIAVVDMVRKRFKLGNVTLLTAMWLIPLVVSFVVSFFVGMFLDRYFYFVLPAYLLALSAYCHRLTHRRAWLFCSIGGAMVLLMALSCKPDDTRLRYAGWKGDVSATAQRMLELEQEESCNIVIAPQWIDKQLVYYFDPTHTAFLAEGRVEQQVFVPYLTPRGYLYCDNIQMPERPLVHIVREQWYPVDEWVAMLEGNGYIWQGVETFQQQEIITYRKTE